VAISFETLTDIEVIRDEQGRVGNADTTTETADTVDNGPRGGNVAVPAKRRAIAARASYRQR
jgi:hypothetical protein